MKLCKLLTILVFVGSVFPRLAVGGLLNPGAGPLAYDNMESLAYTTNNWQLTDNGGSGFTQYTTIQGTPPIKVTSTGDALDGGSSLVANYDTSAYAVGRPFAFSSEMSYGWFDVLARFDDPLGSSITNFYGFSLQDSSASGSAPGSFFNHSLLAFGLTRVSAGNFQIQVIAGSVTNLLALGGSIDELGDGDTRGLGLAGDTLEFLVNWETRNGQQWFSLAVTNLSQNVTGSRYATMTGQLAGSRSVQEIGVANFNGKSFQNLTFDNMAVGIPEPGVAMLWLTGLGTIYAVRRPWHKLRQRKA